MILAKIIINPAQREGAAQNIFVSIKDETLQFFIDYREIYTVAKRET